MYYIAYNQGNKLFEGTASTVADCLSRMPNAKYLDLESTFCGESKWSQYDSSVQTPVMYIRPTQ